MNAKIIETGRSLGTAAEPLFGFNIEWITDVPEAISSERLSNPTFHGPADPQSGLARPWSKVMQFHGGIHFDLEEGHNLVGGPAQRVHVYDHKATGGGAGLVQPHRWVREGETLRAVIWARCQGEPVELRLGFRHVGLAGPEYASATVKIEYSHFRPYVVDLPISATDDDCLFFCYLTTNGMVYFDSISTRPVDQPMHRAETVEAMRELSIGDIRWPGGCVASGYHWRNGVGRMELRKDGFDPTFFWGLCYTWGTDEYLDLCHQLGIRPHITINISTGTPREAGEWAAYCADWYRKRGLEPAEMVWQIGNEHPGPHEIGHMTREMYAKTLREFVPPLKENYPQAIISTLCLDIEWAKAIFAEGTDNLVDMFATHFYACRVDSDPIRESMTFLGDAVSFAKSLDDFDAFLKEQQAGHGFAITEWGAFRSESHTDAKFCAPHTTWTVMFVAAMLNEYCRRAQRVKLADNYSLLNSMPTIVARGPQAVRTAVHDIFKFWRPLFPAEIREVTCDSPRFEPPKTKNVAPWLDEKAEGSDSLPWLDTLAGNTTEAAWLLLTNRHPEKAITVELPAQFAGATAEFLLPAEDCSRYVWPLTSEQLAGSSVTVPAGAHCRVQAVRSK
ncbi:MAG: hypothetical protein ACYDBB_26955 [Armatimonadota bacterium]